MCPQIDSDSEDDDGSGYDEGPRPKKVRIKMAPAKCETHDLYLPCRSDSEAATSHRSTPNVATPQSDSEDEYIQSRRQQLNKTQKQRQLQVAAGIIQETERNTRVDTRRAGLSVKNYNEDENDDDLVEDAGEFGDGYWAPDAQETGPQVDIVLNHQLNDGLEMHPELTRDDFQYLIKWQDKAHLHATWSTYQDVKAMGLRTNKLDNYWKLLSSEKGEINIKTNSEIDVEEQEEWLIRRDEYLQALEDHQKISRVIASREGESGTEYYVLWKLLPYDKCTWEESELVSRLAQNEIDRYLDRVQNVPRSKPRQSTRHVPLLEQPDYIKFGELREFQLKGLNFLCHSWLSGKNVILADEMGLGKTVQTVAWLNWLRHAQSQQGPFLVVIPLSTMPAWADTFDKWAPDVNYVQYHGNRTARDIIQQFELLIDQDPRRPKFHVIITTYELANKESDFLNLIKWQAMVIDEAHRLKNRESKLYEALAKFNVGSKLLLTGTPLQNNLSELSALMDFIAPGAVEIDETIDIQDREAATEKLANVNATMRRYMLRRTKKMVMTDLPPLNERALRVVLSDTQVKLATNIVERNYSALNAGASGPKQSLLNIMMELKKCCNHPFLFPNQKEMLTASCQSRDEYLRMLISTSCKMILLDQLLAKLKREGHRVLIFTQMVKMLDILGEYLRMRSYRYQRLDGTVPAPARARAMEHFQAPDSDDFCFILSTRAGGLGLNLMSADTVIIFDSDWNPQADIQAISRSHRMGQKRPVNAYRFVAQDTVEEKIQERARNKRILEYITIQYGYGDNEKKEKEKQLHKAGVVTGEPTNSADLSKILMQGSMAMFQQSDNQKKLEELDIDQILANAEVHDVADDGDGGFLADGGEDFLKSFQYTDVKLAVGWDEIIPQDRLDVLKAEEQKRLEEEETKRLLDQERPRKRKAATHEAREQRAANKRAKAINKEVAAMSDDDDDDGKNDDSDADVDPKRPLNIKETRNLLEAYKKFGFFEDAQTEILKEARLENRDHDVLTEILQAAYVEAEKLYKDSQEEVETQEPDSSKLPAKKERKEVLFNFRGTKNQNATTIIERPEHLRLMRNAVKAAGDPKAYRVTMARKAADYTCDWGAREDGMLVVGVVKHGYGAWAEIRDDVDLGMTEKLFLEEKRVATVNENKEKKDKGEKIKERKPQATHLVRRIKYLIDCLKVQAGTADSAAMKALENHHRNRKKLLAGGLGGSTSNMSSPGARAGTPTGRKANRDVEKIRNRGNSRAESQPRPKVDRNGIPELSRKISDEPRAAKVLENRDTLKPDSGDGKKRTNSSRDSRVDHKRRLSGLSADATANRRTSNDLDRKRRRDGDATSQDQKRNRSRDRPSNDSKHLPPNGVQERSKPRLSDDQEQSYRGRGESFETYDNYDNRRDRDRHGDGRHQEHQPFRNRPRSRSPDRKYRRDEERSYNGDTYTRDRHDRYDDRPRRDGYDRNRYDDRDRERQSHYYRPERGEHSQRESHGSPRSREDERRFFHDSGRDDRPETHGRPSHREDQRPGDLNRHASTNSKPDSLPARPLYEDRATGLVGKHLPELKDIHSMVSSASDKAVKSKHIKSWLYLVSDIVEKNGVGAGSSLEGQIW